MFAIVTPSAISGLITAPASKSAMQRACAAALIRGGETILYNPGKSADDLAALNIIRQLGASVTVRGNEIMVNSPGLSTNAGNIHCGESGLSVRMFTSIASLSSNEITVSGEGSLVKRPMNFFDEILPQLDVECRSKNGYLPLKIKGPLHPRNITVDGSLSSQYLTGLLFAFSAAKASDVTITVQNLNSRPYIDLTLRVMEAFGLRVPEHSDYNQFYFPAMYTNNNSHTLDFHVEADWSGAAFLLVAGAVAGNISVKGLDVFSTQADKNILQALMQSEAVMSITQEQVDVRKNKLKAFHFNATDCPDLFPPLAALAAHCQGTSVIEGVHRLLHKESNRAITIRDEFNKMGIDVQLQDDLMVIRGDNNISGAEVSSHHDHRIAMACAIAGLTAHGATRIEYAEAVNKSYPQFWEHLQKIGAGVSLNNN